MSLVEQVFAQAVLLSGSEDPMQNQLLRIFCRSSVVSLTARLRAGLTPDDCKADFVASAALFALAALSESDESANFQQLQLGDLTLRPGGNAAAKCLRNQAGLMMAPYLKDRFSFKGV